MKAYAKSKTPPGEGDKRATPWLEFERIQEETGLIFFHDVCAEAHTTKVSESYWTKEDDALSFDWCSLLGAPYSLSALWMNPPYSKPEPWCKKAYEESRKGLIVVGCLPDDRSVGWYQDWIEDKAPLVYVPDRRISFDGQNGNPKGSVFPVWMPMRVDKTSYIRFEI